MTLTVGRIIDIARAGHPAFANVAADGLMVSALDARVRSLVLRYIDSIEGLISRTVELATRIDGALVGIDENGDPYYLTTSGDGWPVQVDEDDIPFIDTDEPAIALDPFGENGGTPGFPLPGDFLKIVNAVAVATANNALTPLTIIPEKQRLSKLRTNSPVAFVSGNRLVPARALSENNAGDPWSLIGAIQLTYVALPVLEALDDELVLPQSLTEVLVTFIQGQMAMHAAGLSLAEKKMYRDDALRAEAALNEDSVALTRDVETNSVSFRG